MRWIQPLPLSTFKVRTYLEHLNKSNAEIQIRLVSADQAQTEKEANGNNRAQVYSSRHFDRLPPVQQSGCSSHNLRHQGCECQMPCRQDYWELEM